ncbi:MAG: Methyltransferase domain [Solirubrobacteraceae bacterium]
MTVGGAQRILDHVWIVEQHSARKQEAMLAFLFNHLSDAYDAVIDRERNLANIEAMVDHLLVGAQAWARRGRELLDVGCGTGLSVNVAMRRGVAIVGTDVSADMVGQARSAGLETIALLDLESAVARFAGAFASYVFHLDPEPSDLPAIMRAIAGDGRMIANFHKGHGLRRFTTHASTLGYDVSCPRIDAGTRHGPYVSVRTPR